MITLWISASLLALTGWQGYRLGKEYGWWGRGPVASSKAKEQDTATSDMPRSAKGGLGRSKTDFKRLLDGFAPEDRQAATLPELAVETEYGDTPIIEPTTTLLINPDFDDVPEYPDETDQIPETCGWLDEEAISLIETEDNQETVMEQPTATLNDYVKRVRTVQRKMNQLTQRRNADATFMKNELGVLIQTYQLDNDQSLDWLFQQHEPIGQADYGSIFDRIEQLAA